MRAHTHTGFLVKDRPAPSRFAKKDVLKQQRWLSQIHRHALIDIHTDTDTHRYTHMQHTKMTKDSM